MLGFASFAGDGASSVMNQLSSKPSRILIVENDQDTIRLATRILNSAGYEELQVLTDAGRVISACRELRPDLILLAVDFPQSDGFALVKLITDELARDIYVPVLLIATEMSAEARAKAISVGVKDFLSKPLDSSELLFRVETHLQTRSLYTKMQGDAGILERRVEERTRELEEAQIETLQRLALTAEYRDDETGQHAERIGMLAANLAQALGRPREEVRLVRLAAPLHDIGKIGIPDRVLTKPGKLSYAEFAIMKSHTIIGGEILSGSRNAVLQMARQIALSHHERWDGTGYPQAISGELIPMAARITAIADVFDALTHARPYKEALPLDEAMKILAEERAKHFDPALVQAFLPLLKTQGPEKLTTELSDDNRVQRDFDSISLAS